METLLLSLVLPGIETTLLGDALDFEDVLVFEDAVVKGTDRKILVWMAAADPRLRLVHGRLPFGMHRNLARDSAYLAVVSHPVARVLEEIALIARKPKHPLHALLERCGGDVAAFAATPEATVLHNRHTAAIAGPEGKAFPSQDPRLLELALRNLKERFRWVGRAETLLADAKELGRQFRREIVPHGRVPALRSDPAIEAVNALDLELYRLCAGGAWK